MSKKKLSEKPPVAAAKPEYRPQPPFFKYMVWIPFVFAFILYGNTLTNEFALDDLPQIVNNKFVQQGFGGISQIISTDYWSGSGVSLGYYRPLSLITFAIEKAAYDNNPMMMHLVNVFLYALTGVVLFLLLSLLFRNMPFFVLAVTLLFMAHPIHTEVVANIKSRDEILSLLNSIMALWLVFRYSKTKFIANLILAWIFYFLALMSKETAMTTLVLVPMLLFFFTPKKGGYIGGIMLSFFVLSLIFLAVKYTLIGTLTGDLPNDLNNYPYREVSGRIPTMLYILGMYFYRLIMPARLLYDYSYNQIPEAGWANPVVLLTLLIILALAYFAIINLKRKSVVSFAILFFGATMSVGLMFVLSRGGIMAERFLYAPVLGFALVLGYYLHKLVPRDAKTKQAVWNFRQNGPKLFVGVIAVLLVFYSVRTVARNPVWKNNLTLFSNDIKFGGNSAQLQKHYGSELINQSVAAEDKVVKDSLMKLGLSHVEKAIEINPRFSEAYFKLGYAYYQLRDYPKAIDYYKKTNQNVSMNLSNMSLAYYMNGDYGEAVKIMQKAIQLNPENPTAKQNMPMLKQAFNRKLQAMKKEKSQDPQHFYELGNLFVEEANYKDALQSFDMAVSLKPDFTGALVNKGNCLYMLKDYNAAIKAFEAVLAVEPNSQIAFKNLSTLYGMLGNNDMQLFYNNKIEGAK